MKNTKKSFSKYSAKLIIKKYIYCRLKCIKINLIFIFLFIKLFIIFLVQKKIIQIYKKLFKINNIKDTFFLKF